MKKFKVFTSMIAISSLLLLTLINTTSLKAAEIGISLKSLNSITLEAIPNVTYEICGNSLFTGTVHEVTSDAQGVAAQLNLTQGIYFYRMKSVPLGYVKQTLVATVSVGLTGVTLINNKIVPQGNIKIEKVDDQNAPVVGAEFSLFMGSLVTGTPIMTGISTGADGTVTIPNLDPGIYALLETQAPEGYHMDILPKVITVLANQTATVKVVNTIVVRASIQLYKKDAVSDTQLAGAKFGVYKDALHTQLVKEVTSSASEAAIVDNLLPGTYYIKELQVPEGYLMDAIPQVVLLIEGQVANVTFYNHRDYPTAGNFAGPLLLGGAGLSLLLVMKWVTKKKKKV